MTKKRGPYYLYYLRYKKLLRSVVSIIIFAALAVIGFYFYARNYLPPTQPEAEAYLETVRASIQLKDPGVVVDDKVYNSGCGVNQTSWVPLQKVCIENLELYYKGEESSSSSFDYKTAKSRIQALDEVLRQAGWTPNAGGIAAGAQFSSSEFDLSTAGSYSTGFDYFHNTPYPNQNPTTLYINYFKASDPRSAGQHASDVIGIDIADLQPNEYVYGVSLGIAYRQHWWGW